MITCKYLFIEVYRIKNFVHQNLPGSKVLSKVNEGRDIYSQCGWVLWVSKQKRTFIGEQHACKGATWVAGRELETALPVAGGKLWEEETHLKICLKFLFNAYFNRLLIFISPLCSPKMQMHFSSRLLESNLNVSNIFFICLFFEGLDGQIHVSRWPNWIWAIIKDTCFIS